MILHKKISKESLHESVYPILIDNRFSCPVFHMAPHLKRGYKLTSFTICYGFIPVNAIKTHKMGSHICTNRYYSRKETCRRKGDLPELGSNICAY